MKKQRLLSLVLAAAVACGSVPVPAFAQEGEPLDTEAVSGSTVETAAQPDPTEPPADSDTSSEEGVDDTENTGAANSIALFSAQAMNTGSVSYLDESGQSAEYNGDYTVLSDSDTEWQGGWYVAEGSVTIQNRIAIQEDAYLVLADGAELIANNGLQIASGKTLTIYAQTQDETTMGRLQATGPACTAGIQVTDATLMINGGTVDATAPASVGEPAGIGGSGYADAGTIVINNGIVRASGCGKGIGGGAYTSGGSITINGGVVQANGIGTGNYDESHPVFIYSGLVDSSADINQNDKSNWKGIIIENGNGSVYGDATFSGSFTLDSGKTLTIPQGVTLTNNGTIINNGTLVNSGTIQNNGTIINCGVFQGNAVLGNPLEGRIPYLDENGDNQVYAGTYTTVAAGNKTWTDGWYVAEGNVSISSQITCRGNVNLILTDGCSLEAGDGIYVAPYASLTIYAQSEGDDMGTLNAYSDFNSGIGGKDITEYNEERVEIGSITIHGGNITAVGGANSAGIGSSGADSVYNDNATGLDVTITGGKVYAVGGEKGGAGIGSGYAAAAGTVTITGGTVTATASGSRAAAGIGVGANGGGVDITITGGSVDAKGVGGADDIGDGNGNGLVNQPATFTTGSDGRAVIYADSITGSEDTSAWNCLVMNHDLTQGSVYGNVAMDGELDLPDNMQFTVPTGAALTVGNMSLTEMATVEISGTLTNTGTIYNYGTIRVMEGGQYEGRDSIPNAVLYMHVPYLDEDGNLTYVDDVRKVTSNSFMLEPGWYMLPDGDTNVYYRLEVVGDVHLILTDGSQLQANDGISVNEGNSLTIYAQSNVETTMGNLTATAIEFGSSAGIGADYRMNAGSVTIYGGKVSATGGRYAAGIGGARNGAYGSVVIHGGLVEANAGEEAAGIGGGLQDSGGSVLITGGCVTAKGDGDGAGIGAGSGGNGGDIVIQGGIVTAQGAFNAAIGGYNGGSFSTGTDGNAVIFVTNDDNRDEIGDRSGEAEWNAVILEGENGQYHSGRVYGQVTRKEGFTVPEGCVLTIPAGASLTMQDGAQITTNDSTVEVQLGGTYTGGQLAPNPVDYEIGWDSDGDGNADANEYYTYGETPVYGGSTPEKAPDGQYSYHFDGWTPTIGPVQAAVLYTAQFTSSLNQYKVIMPTGEGYTIRYNGSDTVQYGDIVSFTVELEPGYTATDAFVVKANNTELTPGGDGAYSVTVTADTTITVEGVADVTAPDVTVTWKSGQNSGILPADNGSPDPAFTVADSIEITITATDAGTGVQAVSYQLEGEQPVTVEDDTVTFTIDKDFIGQLQNVTAVDQAGNASAAATCAPFVVEVTVPTKPVVDNAGYTADSWATEDVTLTPGGATTIGTIDHYEYSVDDGRNWTPMTGASLAVTENTDGTTYIFRAVSAVGKQGESSDAVTVKLDKTEPLLTLSAHTDTYRTDDTVELSASAGVSGIAKVEAQKDGGNWQDITDTYTKGYAVTENGTYLFRLTNGAGKSVQQSLTYDKLDATKPVVTLDTHGYTPEQWATNTVTITATASQNVAPVTLDYKVDKGDWRPLNGDLVVAEDTTGTTYTFRATSASGVQSDEVTLTVKRDTVSPDGSIKVAENTFKKAINQISFGLFFHKNVDVTISGTDATSGVQSIEYLRSESILSEEDVKAAVGWLPYTAPIGETAEDAARFVYYARVTDKAGHTTWFGADGVIFDTTAPSIQGVADGGMYYTTQKLTVQDVNLAQVTVNGNVQPETSFTLAGDKEAEYTVEATDKAGNTTTVTLTMKTLTDLGEGLEDLTPDKVTSTDKDKIEEVLADVEEQLQNENLTDEEKQKLEDLKSEAEDLLDKIEQAGQAGHTDSTDKVENVTADNVKLEDKQDLETAKEDLESALENFGGNMTEEEKTQLEEELDRINQALESLNRVENVGTAIGKLPDTVEPDDTDAEAVIQAAKELYDALTEHEKTLISSQDKEKLDDLLAALLDYRVIEGDKSTHVVEDGTDLTIKANGPLSKFTGLLVDDKTVDPDQYTVVSGSTIVTLKDSYLDTLSVGQHSLTFLYEDGQTTGTFTIQAKPATPAPTPTQTPTAVPTQTPTATPAPTQSAAPATQAPDQSQSVTDQDTGSTPAPVATPTPGHLPQTGDNSHLALWIALLAVVCAAFIGVLVYRRKKN